MSAPVFSGQRIEAPMPSFPSSPAAMTLDELLSYDTIIVAFSGGKDSVACVLHLLHLGIPRDRIELWHHDVDGREGSELMDWPVTRSYCRRFAEAIGVEIYYSWKQGGFEGEMLRSDALTRPVSFEVPGGTKTSGGVRGKKSTRMMFPQVSPDLSVRWCSAYLKIDVCTAAINNQDRFLGKRTLLVTGERADESASRAKYKILEPHKSDNRDGRSKRRHVDQWRPVHQWTEAQVWAILEAYRIDPHPCYKVGFSRCSCMPCIFGNADQWATVQRLDPSRFERLSSYEESFGKTIKRKVSLRVLAAQGKPYAMRDSDAALAMRREFDGPIVVENWTMPAGAFGESCGPV